MMTTYIATATAIVTTMVAVLVAAITWGQWRTNRARLRHELFDRRYDAYEKIAGFVANVCTSGCVEPGSDVEFLRQTKQAYFIFGCDRPVRDFLDAIYKHAVTLQTLQKKEEHLSGASATANVEKQDEEKEWFRAVLTSLQDRFGG